MSKKFCSICGEKHLLLAHDCDYWGPDPHPEGHVDNCECRWCTIRSKGACDSEGRTGK